MLHKINRLLCCGYIHIICGSSKEYGFSFFVGQAYIPGSFLVAGKLLLQVFHIPLQLSVPGEGSNLIWPDGREGRLTVSRHLEAPESHSPSASHTELAHTCASNHRLQ